MFTTHKNIFVTFCNSDKSKAIAFVRALEKRHSDLKFVGRHRTGGAISIEAQINASTLTLILESPQTHLSKQVKADFAASLAKAPPNAILCVALKEDEQMPANSSLVSHLGEAGVERVVGDPAAVDDALVRCNQLYRTQMRIGEAAKTTFSGGGGCGR